MLSRQGKDPYVPDNIQNIEKADKKDSKYLQIYATKNT